MEKLINLTDEALMELLQTGSSNAFEEIYNRYSKPLLSLMYSLLNNKEALAQDLLHDVFLKLIEKPEQFDTKRRFKPWFYTVATNECRKAFRQKITSSREQIVNENLGSSPPSDILQRQDKAKILGLALNKLSYEHKEVFVLKHMNEMSISEIAHLISCAEGTVKSRLYSSRNKLAQILKSYQYKL
ncbi:MAG: RNA polymerase sigma factor [Bacteroidia bacterium]